MVSKTTPQRDDTRWGDYESRIEQFFEQNINNKTVKTP